MIANYLYTIGRHLPPRVRDDVLKDIEVNLYDYLEENFGKKEYTDEELEKAIRSMGHPHMVAEAYLDQPRGLIGPVYIDAYWLVVKIAVFGIAVGLTIANIINLSGFTNGIQLYLQILAQIWQASLTAVGIITLIFAAVQHYTPEETIKNNEAWSLKILENAVEPQQKIKLFEIILGTFFLCLSLVVINQGSSLVSTNGKTFVFFNKAALEPYLLWFNLFILVSLAVNIYLLIQRKWQPATRILTVLLNLAGIAVFTIFAFDPNVWNLAPLASYVGSDLAVIERGIQISIYIGLAAVVIVSAIDIIGHVKVLARRR